jgi:hypothetical protein
MRFISFIGILILSNTCAYAQDDCYLDCAHYCQEDQCCLNVCYTCCDAGGDPNNTFCKAYNNDYNVGYKNQSSPNLGGRDKGLKNS